MAANALRLCLFGAAPDTGNLGVSALCYGTLCSLARARPGTAFTVFDYGRGVRVAALRMAGGEMKYERCGGYATRRLYRRESLWNMRWSAKLGGANAWGNAGVKAMRAADAILDISGGDSFTDLYGPKRFWEVAEPKLMALEIKKKLILPPQTYGPFKSGEFRAVAEHIVRGAAMAWARDARSFAVLKELTGDAFDAQKHRCGMDVAFGLEAHEPRRPLGPPINEWLEDGRGPVVGLNISGLIYLSADGGKAQYGLKADYRGVIEGLLGRFLNQTDARIVLVPHVIAGAGHYESDNHAAATAIAALGAPADGRVAMAPVDFSANEAKWLIGRMDWFCGTRMHSTIAGLSSGVATVAIAYSPKTAGVFESCAVGECVVDPRALGTQEVIDAIWECWVRREGWRERLRGALPGVMGKVAEQAGAMVAAAG